MPLLDSVPVTGCHECVALLTLPLALFLLLAETAVGGAATVAYLRLVGGLTQGFLKFIVGKPAVPYLRHAAQHDASAQVRRVSGLLLRNL